MARRLPPLHWLQAFEATARHMSFTEAARELGVTQSAVSQRVRLLEDRLGQPLFARRARSIELTEAGRAYVPAVRQAFERLAAGTEEVFGPRYDEPLTLRITPGFMILWLAARIGRFRTSHPRITLRITTAIWPSDFGVGDVDLEIRYGRGGWPGTHTRRLTWERLTPVCCPRIAGRLATPADLGEETLLHAVGFETGWPRWLAEAGVPQVAERAGAVLCDTSTVVHELALRGEGVALGRNSFVADALAGGTLVAPFPLELETGDSFYLVRSTQRPPRPEAAALWAWLEKEAGHTFNA